MSVLAGDPAGVSCDLFVPMTDNMFAAPTLPVTFTIRRQTVDAQHRPRALPSRTRFCWPRSEPDAIVDLPRSRACISRSVIVAE